MAITTTTGTATTITEQPTIIINNHKKKFKMICFGVLLAVAVQRKLIINLKMLINLITVFIFIALPLTFSPTTLSDFSLSFGRFSFVFVFRILCAREITAKGIPILALF